MSVTDDNEKNIKYWRKREEQAKQNYITEEEGYKTELARLYNNLLVNVETQINGFYQKYAASEKLTMAEAKQKVADMDVQAFKDKAKQYVKTKDFSKQANQELKLYNATMKINRLELLNANIGLEMISTFDEMQGQFDENLFNRAIDEFSRQAGILGMGVDNAPKMARTIVNASFHNADFSTRIWMYQGQLRNELSSLLLNGIVQGINSKDLARHIERKFGASRSNAERLMRTEMARVQTAAQEESFRANGYDKYIFLAIGTACPICKQINEQVFDLSKMNVAENAPPMHPNCRCSTAAWMGRGSAATKMKAMSQVEDNGKNSKNIFKNRNNGNIMQMNLQYFATIKDEKLTEYALNPQHPSGKYKAVAFKRALGYTRENYKDLKSKILELFDEKKLVYKYTDKYGKRYEQIMKITGTNGKTANVVTAWVKDNDESEPRLVSVYVK